MSTESAIAPALQRSECPPDVGIPLVEGTVGGLLREQARRIPDVTALVATTHAGEHRRWSYSELLNAARHTSGSLLTVAEPGDHVAIWAPNVAEWPVVQYAAALAGMTLVALDPALRPADLEYCLKLSQATLLIHADSMQTYDMADVVAHVISGLPDLLDAISLSDVGRLYGSPVVPEELSAPAAPAMMLFTSGRPKGVLLAHRSLVNNARFTMLAAEVAPGVTTVATLPGFHPSGCVTSHLGSAAIGATMALIEVVDPAQVLATIVDEGASVLMSAPPTLDAVLDAARQLTTAPHLDTVLVGVSTAAGTTIDAVEQTFGASVHTLYGQAELSAVLSLARRSRADLVGSVLPHTACRIVDPVGGEVVPLGVPGEICARGYNQMIEYFDDPAANTATVDAEGWLHTGDHGTMDDRGTITVTGRISAMQESKGVPC